MKYTLLISLYMLTVQLFAVTKGEADALYEKGEYQSAAEAYEQLLKTNGESAEVYYNLGNCYYKVDDIPHAVLNYERAHLISPNDADINANLDFIRTKTIDKYNVPSEMFFVSWWDSMVNMMSGTAWCCLGIVAFVLMLAGVVLYMFMSSVSIRKVGFYGACIMLFVTILANVCAFSHHSKVAHRQEAIIMQSVVTVKSSPSDDGTDLFMIHEGSKVQILDDTMKGWVEVKFEEGKQGWIETSSAEII